MDHTLHWGESPVDLPDEELLPADDPADSVVRSGIGWACGAVLTSSLALVVFNSHALANWADQLPVVPATAPVVALADGWRARAGQLGLNGIVDRVEQGAAAMRKAQWPQSSPKVTPQR